MAIRDRFGRTLLLALIELGYVDKVECHYEHCLFETREFGEGKRKLSFDHILRPALGGSDDPSNITIMHLACNSSKGSKERTEEELVRSGVVTKELWKTNPSVFNTRSGKSHHRPRLGTKNTPEHRQKISEGLTKAFLEGRRSPYSKRLSHDQRIEIRNKYANGGYTHRRLADEYGCAQTTIARIISHG